MKEIIRCNIKIPGESGNCVGFAYKTSKGKHKVKTIHGVVELKDQYISFFSESKYFFKPGW